MRLTCPRSQSARAPNGRKAAFLPGPVDGRGSSGIDADGLDRPLFAAHSTAGPDRRGDATAIDRR
jgi:hypothetical protein